MHVRTNCTKKIKNCTNLFDRSNIYRGAMMSNLRVPVGLRVILTLLLLERGTISGSGANNPNDKSICRRYHRVTVTKLVSYRETYMSYDSYDYESRDYHHINTRLNFRNENMTKWEPIEMCCDGYEPHQKAQEASTCVPVCPSDCVNGTCLRPNVCMCDPGYRMEINNLTTYSECVPICASGCNGGRCIAPDICICEYGYVSSNNETSCEATCTAVGGAGPRGCVRHATCVSPDTCECDDGYVVTPNSSPMEKRSLLDWFNPITQRTILDASTKFHTRNNTCRPLCKPECGNNSSCVAPDNCQCDDGYKSVSTLDQVANDTQCLPICNKTCFNGFCEYPNKCKCLDGYKPHRLLNQDFCEPICHEECVNAKCSAPNRCDCMDGYEKLTMKNGDDEEKVSENICVPICPGKCPNGRCVSPGKCHCDPGYVLVVQGSNETGVNVTFGRNSGHPMNSTTRQSCRPLCKPGCFKGSLCIAPNQCQSETNLHQQGFKDFRKVDMVFVNDTRECRVDDDRFRKENGSCVCEYNVDERRCTIPALCAAFFTDDSGAQERFALLQSIVFRNDTPEAKIDTFVQEGLRCTDKCRFAIFPKRVMTSIVGRIDNCYLLETHDKNTGLLSTLTRFLSTISGLSDETMICLVQTEPKCSVIESKIVSGQSSVPIGGIIGTIFLIALIVGLVVIAKKSDNQLGRKMRKIGGFGGTSQSMGNMMEQSETLESPFHTDGRPDP